MVNITNYLGKSVDITLKNGKTISGKILEADCTGAWCKIIVKTGDWKVIKGAEIESVAVV